MKRICLVAGIFLLTSLQAHAWTCIATCQGPDDESGDQISSKSFASKKAAIHDLGNYCHVTYIYDIKCSNRGNPSGD